ncbi:MAG: hypothetical protein NWE88_11170 [Candidatus Bathyarchaeota archaeon]|nr:hypothetical protein [Candidatus Bathyarchaeota archaeon]
MGREYFEEAYAHKSDSETTVDIELPEPIKGHRRVTTRVVFESETSNIGKTRVYLKRGRVLFPFAEEAEPEDGVLYWTMRDIVTWGREQVLVRFTGVHDEDILNVWEFGYHEEA